MLRSLDLPNVRRARKAFRAALEASPDFAPALSSIAHTKISEWLLLGRSDKTLLREARDIAQESIALDPLHGRGFKELGRADLFLGAMDQSLESFRHAEALTPGHADIIADYADALMHNSQMKLAQDKIETALQLNRLPPDEYLWTAGGIAFFLGRYQDALALLHRMRVSAPAYKLMAACAAKLGHAGVTQEFVRKALEVHPDFRVGEWASMVPIRGRTDVEHYVGALKSAGFR